MTHENMSALTIAKQFLFIAEKANRKLTNKKLQKLLYYAQAWSLALNGIPMFEESIEAWIHGPVVRNIYNYYKKYGYKLIEEPTSDNCDIPEKFKEVLEEVWKVYGKYDADYLELLTHREDPWILTRDEIESYQASTNVISHELMRSFYTNLLHKTISSDETKD